MRRKLKNVKFWKLGAASIMVAVIVFSSAHVNAQDLTDTAKLASELGPNPEKFFDFSPKQRTCPQDGISRKFKAFKSYEDEFCRSPFQAVCGHSNYNFEARQKRFEQFNNDLKLNALAEITRLRGPRPKEKRNSESWDAEYSTLFENIQARKLNGMDLHYIFKNVQTVKTYLTRLIDNKLGDHPSAIEMKRIISKTKILNFSDVYYESNALPSGERKQILMTVKKECGGSGLHSNLTEMKKRAFAGRVGSTHYVFICPRWLIETIPESSFNVDFDIEMLQVLSHEIAHHIDNKKYDNVYAKYKECLIQHHADDLLTVNPQSSKEKIDQRFNEITADYWAIQAIKLYVKENPSAKRLDVLRKAYSGLCPEAEVDPVYDSHPSVQFRIENLLRADPIIADYMGCKPVKTGKPGCTINGATEYPVIN